MTRTNSILAIVCVSILVACSSGDPEPEKSQDCLQNVPEHIDGLEVRGARSKENVIRNVWPVICEVQKVYSERLKENPGLKGTIELKLSVEFNGEIGLLSIARNTIKDPEVKRQLMRLIQFMDFDPYGPQNSESEILLPVHFNP